MIRAKNLILRRLDRTLLNNISFELPDGEDLIILGRSGSGKTVLIKTIMGLLTPDMGSIEIDGIEMSSDKSAENIRANFSMVFQNSALLDSFTIFQNVALPLYERGIKDLDQIKTQVTKYLDLLGLKNVLNLYPSELSGGKRKRVRIARALVYEPRYIIFDEPVSGLDPVTSNEILYYITEITNTMDITTITITHDLHRLQNLGNNVLFLDSGELRFAGKLDHFFSQEDPLIKEFGRGL
ncbi:MAG: ATP-binding cassette domain-containing protein [Candidatus Cloacimonetes bacterium]|nr:ATP-binding cassette domain-containing protein [Candidatus Cloacimonadota bacterium]